MTIEQIALWRIRVPLYEPYNLSLGSLSALDAIVAEIVYRDGAVGLGEATIIPGYTPETVDNAWALCCAQREHLTGLDTAAATKALDPLRAANSHAVSVFQVALDMIDGNPLLAPPEQDAPIPVLAPVNSKDHDRIPDKIERLLDTGYRTLKVKVGWAPDDDLERLALIQQINDGRALLRVDANQGYTAEEGTRFVRSLDPESIELVEQPCHCDDWAGNMSVAAVSPVPIMLDESIYGMEDIDRAGKLPGCGFVKLKIAKMTGVDLLAGGLRRIRENGQQPVLGNGAATDIGCWVEASVARHEIDNAGEMCGFLKNREQLLETPLSFDAGRIVLKPGFEPRLNRAVVDRLAVASAGAA
ncbi:MAG: enolase C-terminal domain-like protein [Gammaproteobacteria bacterium]|jgi:L-alanine-DL-glutamate epimerase-like enolase superfamily enzyme